MEVVEAAAEATSMEASTTSMEAFVDAYVETTDSAEAFVDASVETTDSAFTKASTEASTNASTKSFRGSYFHGHLRFISMEAYVPSMEASVASTEAQRLPRQLPRKSTPMETFVEVIIK